MRALVEKEVYCTRDFVSGTVGDLMLVGLPQLAVRAGSANLDSGISGVSA
jgi:hypothetical protein